MIIDQLVNILVESPFYPFWLSTLKNNSAEKRLLEGLSGQVLEVGAGDGARKSSLLQKYPQVTSYLATDYSSWDGEFECIDKSVSRLGCVGEKILGFKKRVELDQVCSATSLPFEDNTFDYHLSFQVLEHIDNPVKYFSEANRVLKPSGKILLSVPFLYRIHGGEPDHKMDHFRYAYGFFHSVAETVNMEIVAIYTNTGVGSAISSLFNQWVIRRIFEGNKLVRLLFLSISPLLFLKSNLLGYLLDIKPDSRFPTQLYISLRKKG